MVGVQRGSIRLLYRWCLHCYTRPSIAAMHFLVWGALGNEKAGDDIRAWGKVGKGQCLLPESQGGEWAFERSRNSETGVLGELSEYSLKKVNIILIQMESKHLSKT